VEVSRESEPGRKQTKTTASGEDSRRLGVEAEQKRIANGESGETIGREKRTETITTGKQRDGWTWLTSSPP